ncbi:MAG TPA: potassium channel protein [Thermodesulfobacteriaceae bacterium]|nr:potassium channel protein [Thermodesulfobacteriaceae bacterium]
MGYVPRVIRLMLFTTFILAAGTAGYRLIEGWAVIDALYMSVITLTTIGFGEIRPLSPAGRIFTIFYIFLGAGFILYLFTAFTEAIVTGQIESYFGRRRMKKKISELRNHYIIAGYGRIGQAIVKILGKEYPLIIIQKDPETETYLEASGHLYIMGDATKDSVLKHAGIKRAKSLVAALAADADNVYLTLTAKELNPEIQVITRADTEGARRRLVRAGADHVVNPYQIGARRMALILAKPTVTDFLEASVCAGSIDRLLELEEIKVEEGSILSGQNLIEANLSEQCNVILLSIKKTSGENVFNPSYMYQIDEGDVLVVLGEAEALKCLERIARAGSSRLL